MGRKFSFRGTLGTVDVQEFDKLKTARKFQGKFVKNYGYVPAIFEGVNPKTKKKFWAISKPRDLERI